MHASRPTQIMFLYLIIRRPVIFHVSLGSRYSREPPLLKHPFTTACDAGDGKTRGSVLNGAKYFPDNYLSRHFLTNLMSFNGRRCEFFNFSKLRKDSFSVTVDGSGCSVNALKRTGQTKQLNYRSRETAISVYRQICSVLNKAQHYQNIWEWR
jgi:hypothetical protein